MQLSQSSVTVSDLLPRVNSTRHQPLSQSLTLNLLTGLASFPCQPVLTLESSAEASVTGQTVRWHLWGMCHCYSSFSYRLYSQLMDNANTTTTTTSKKKIAITSLQLWAHREVDSIEKYSLAVAYAALLVARLLCSSLQGRPWRDFKRFLRLTSAVGSAISVCT